MRRSFDLFNIQAALLFVIILVTIYIYTIKVNLNHLEKNELIYFKSSKENVINTLDDVKLIEKIKELPTKESSLFPVIKILNGKQNYIFKAETLPKDDNYMPFMSNGHLGYRVYGNAVYMNGLYSGEGHDSHRAWIPNYGNLRIYYCEYNEMFKDSCQWRFNIHDGVFIEHVLEKRFELFHLTYAHRAYKNFIVNQIYMKRREGTEKISLNMLHLSGDEEDDDGKRIIRDDIIFDEEKTGKFNQYEIITKVGHQKEFEDSRFQMGLQRVSIMYNTIPQELIMLPNETFLSLKYLMSVSYETETRVVEDFYDLLLTPDQNLLKLHTDMWNKFWDDTPNVIVKDNNELASAIHSSIFNLASSIPMSFASPTFFGPMSPNKGHTTSENELWILPALNLINSNFSKMLLNYRFHKLPVAMKNAEQTGNAGARYPVKSAYSGIELESEINLLNALHVSADVSFAMRQYYAVTHDTDWLLREGCIMSKEIAKFWASYVSFNETTGYYDIKNVTGPDQNYPGVDNDLYTNVAAGYALFFGRFTECLCSILKQNYSYDKEVTSNFDRIGSHITFPFDETTGTSLKFSGFRLDMLRVLFNQPDVVMLQYPLEYKIKKEQLKTNYQLYMPLVNLHTTPSLTYAIHSIVGLDLHKTDEAENDFKKIYHDFITFPFNVWCEKNESHHIIGAAAFIQNVFNGYAGIRLHVDHLIIKKPILLPNSSGLEINGLTYLGAKYNIIVTSENSYVMFKTVSDESPLHIKPVGSNKLLKVRQLEKYEIPQEGLKIRTIDNSYHGCKLPLDEIGLKLQEEKVPVEDLIMEKRELTEQNRTITEKVHINKLEEDNEVE